MISNQKEVRRFFAQIWQKRCIGHLSPMEERVLKIIVAHPEYTPYLENIEEYIHKEWHADNSEHNPFLHLSLHLSLQEQVAIDQPRGIAAIHQKLSEQKGSAIEAEHVMMGPLTEMIWKAQKYHTGLDVTSYLEALRVLAYR
ncbi:MAG: DUF1841 domain-containing protein [Haemophilus parainfluenzae]|jgi:hypothetical protein|nr:MAG: DUF1841 domain-containing protein [Haemophilus parainfluenzae]